jgi:TRAP-type C4-dicarboxylate transport system substrate-binding protein
MGRHSATKSHPQGPIPTAAPRASKWAPQNVMTVNGLTRRRFLPVVLAVALGVLWGSLDRVFGAGSPVKVRLGTLAPRGSSYTKHLLAMGERWRQAPGGGVLLTVYPDGVMGSEADMVRRMRLGQLQAGMLTATGLAEIEPAVTGLQYMPLMFHSLAEVDYIGEKLQPMLEKRLEEKGFMVLFWADTGWVRFFSKQPVIRPDDLRKSKLFVGAGNAAQVDSYRSIGFHPVPLETVDVLPSLQTGLINAVPLPPSIALAGQVDGVAPHMLDLDWAPLVGAAVMTKKTWDTIPAEGRDAVRKVAAETGALLKADGRRESAASVEAMRKRGLTVHAVTPDVEAEWRREVEAAYPKIRGVIVPVDIFDEVVAELKTFRAARVGGKK